MSKMLRYWCAMLIVFPNFYYGGDQTLSVKSQSLIPATYRFRPYHDPAGLEVAQRIIVEPRHCCYHIIDYANRIQVVRVNQDIVRGLA